MMTSFILPLKLPIQIMIEIEKIGVPGWLPPRHLFDKTLIHTSLTLDSYWFLKITPFVFSPLLFSKLLDAINFCCDRKIKEVECIRA